MFSYLRFLTRGAARTVTIIVMALCIAFHLTFLLVQINLCQPVSLLTLTENQITLQRHLPD